MFPGFPPPYPLAPPLPPVSIPGPRGRQGGHQGQRAAGPHRGAPVGHGEDPPPGEPAERPAQRDPGEGESGAVSLSARIFSVVIIAGVGHLDPA